MASPGRTFPHERPRQTAKGKEALITRSLPFQKGGQSQIKECSRTPCSE
jgi:hypothetical protein